VSGGVELLVLAPFPRLLAAGLQRDRVQHPVAALAPARARNRKRDVTLFSIPLILQMQVLQRQPK
jgi:hypothetical protein